MIKGWATLLILLLSFHLYAQKQGNIWYFGKNAGLDFNSNPPVTLTNGALSTNEGCATICDENGALLFYTDGVTVYNKQHQVMLNGTGLLGHPSSTQSAVIVPWPEKDSLYYIFTADANDNNGARGYNYSVVNINKDQGKGEIILKNQKLYSPSTEKLVAAKHSNDMDWWVITRQEGNDQFNAYLIDKDGIKTTPVLSKAGNGPLNIGQSAGCISISPDFKKLAVAYTSISYFEIYDFDNDKGTLYNPIQINTQNPYGLSFSPNAKMLYVSSMNINNSNISQYDVSAATDPISLETTRIIITPASPTQMPLGLQLGPDNKIYVNYNNAVGVIHEPDNKGLACRLEENAIDLKNRKAGIMFPTIILKKQTPLDNFTIGARITISDPCKREVQFEAISSQTTNVTYKWAFGFGASSTIYNPEIAFPLISNAYLIQLEVTADVVTVNGQQRLTKTFSKWIQFEPLPEANAGNDMIALAGESFRLMGAGGSSFQWTPSQFLNDATIAEPIATLQKDQTFILTASNNAGCTTTDTMNVKVIKEARIYVPTAFTPNGDGKNEVLKCLPVGVKLKSFRVHNRWGNLVFSTTDHTKGWNGIYNGKKQPDGTYVWIVEGTDFKGQPFLKKGTTLLMR